MTPVLALHCALASGAAWRGLRAAMPGVEMTCPDLPGHGDAPDWDRGVDFQTQALALALDAAPDGPLHVVGHSFGGTLGLRLLADRPDRVASLALIEPVMFAAAGPALQRAHEAAMAPYREALAAGDRDGAARAFTGLWGDGRAWDALRPQAQAYIRDRIHLIDESGPAIADDVHGILDRLPEDPPPVLIVTRDDPPEIMAGIAEGLAARLPGARVERLGRGHMIPMEESEELAGMLRTIWGK